MKTKLWYLITIVVILSMTVGAAMAEDGKLFRRNISKTPDWETEKAAIFMMDFYVPAQASTGLVGPVDNYLAADEITETYPARSYAKPLISVYIDGPSTHTMHEEEGAPVTVNGGIVFGEMDAFVGVSLDDGTTWKTTNISKSADLSSINVNLPEPGAYPGHVHAVVHQVFNDNILMAWASKYCEGGAPLYSLDPVADALYLTDLETNPDYAKDAVYLYDFFGVGGSQGIVDYTEQGYPEIGEIPFSCIWTARGKLLAGDDPATTDVTEASYVMWAKPERLTSGKRDANLPAVDCAAGAGCMLTWQEDPEGLRPGQGLGPGEGWSGAVANQKTDIWYSHISFADFDKVFAVDDEVGAVTMAAYAAGDDETMPKSYVPMAIPVRLTDNNMCKSKNSDPYCYIDFDTLDDVDHTNVQALLDLTAPEADADFCMSTVSWLNPGGTTLDLCVTKDNRLLNGRVAATRVRMNFKPYTKADGTKSAWIVMAAEESKALGEILDPDGEPIDIGKDVWYFSFDPFKTGADEAMVMQGGMLNQPAVCKDTDDEHCTTLGEFYDIQVDLRGFDYYLTEISRRFALTTNSVKDADESVSGLSAMLIYKQGIINQGGPADIMLRRVVVPTDFVKTVDNPYAFENMDCDEWAYTDGLNPNYLQGVCLSPAINITGNTVINCGGAGSDNDTCAAAFPIDDDGSNPSGAEVPKVYEWRQCDGVSSIEDCETDNDLDDQSWENPYDVAKGHRGFLDGDIVMIMYAWAPNWNSNTVGNDHYNLYARRSFDGGLTWTTTPASLGGEGVTYTEYYYDGSIGVPLPKVWTYEAGAFEQGRNVSLLTGNKVTILDPRYSPTGGMKLYPTIRTDWLSANGITPTETLPYEDDAVRDRSKFFIVYETGDNTTVEWGEATPLDLYYSRATLYGDKYEVMDYPTTDDDELLDRWPWLENAEDDLSGEASMLANPGGTFCYVVWNQWREEILPDGHELIYDSDMWFRRLMYAMDGDTASETLPSIIWINDGKNVYTAAEDITLAVFADDYDQSGEGEDIVEYEWTIDGVVTSEFWSNGTKNDTCYKTKQCNVPPRTLSNGWHGFSVRGLDNDGKWSKSLLKEKVLVAEQVFFLNLPITLR